MRFSALPLLFGSFLPLLAACQQDVVVNTPTTPPAERFVTTPATPAPTSANTVTPVPARDLPEDTTARPRWLQDRIAAILGERKRTPIIRVLRYRYNGHTVYYESAPCCDQFSRLYNAQGQVLCAPEGGLTGKGDGKCPDFDKNKTQEQLVWQDPR